MVSLRYSLLFVAFILALFIPPIVGHGGAEGEEEEGPELPTVAASSASWGDGKFNASWSFDESTRTISIEVVAETTGWVGFGWTDDDGKDMKDFDVAVGGTNNGTHYINDYFSNTTGRPMLDSSNDFTMVSCTEADGKTTMKIKRVINTTDHETDFQLDDDEYYVLVWAFGDADATGPTDFAKHASANRGHSTFRYNLITSLKQVAAGASSLVILTITAVLPLLALLVI